MNRPPIKIPDDSPKRVLLHKDWYDILEPLYQYFSDTSTDSVFNVITDKLGQGAEEIIEYIGYGEGVALAVVVWVINLVVTLARAGFILGKFEYIGQFGTTQFGSSQFGSLEIRELT